MMRDVVLLLLLAAPVSSFMPLPSSCALASAPALRLGTTGPGPCPRRSKCVAPGMSMNKASEMQGRIDALLKTAPPPGPPSVPPSAEAVRIRKEAAELYEQLIDLCADDTRTRIKAMNDLGTCLTAAGDMPEAITSFEKAIEAAVSESLPALQCKALMGMSFATARSGSLMKGVELMREAIEVTGKLHEDGPEGRAEMELIALGHLSVLTVMSKQFDDAKEVVARLCAAGKAKSDRMGKATSEELLAQRVRSRLYFELGDRAVAAEAARAVLRLANGECGLLAGGDMVENFEVPLAVKASQEMLKKIDEGTSD